MKKLPVIGITGATGALGRRLTEIASAKGFKAKCLLRDVGKKSFLSHLDVDISVGDLTDKASLCDFVRDIDVCLHLAALVGHGTKSAYQLINEQGTDNLCTAILETNPECRLHSLPAE